MTNEQTAVEQIVQRLIQGCESSIEKGLVSREEMTDGMCKAAILLAFKRPGDEAGFEATSEMWAQVVAKMIAESGMQHTIETLRAGADRLQDALDDGSAKPSKH